MVLLEWGVKKLISDIRGGSNSSQDLRVLKNPECVRIGMLIGTEKSHVKEVRTEIRKEIENGSDHVNDLAIRLGIVIIERIDTTEIGIGIETETGKGKEREIGGVIEIEDVTVIVVGRGTVIERRIVIGT